MVRPKRSDAYKNNEISHKHFQISKWGLLFSYRILQHLIVLWFRRIFHNSGFLFMPQSISIFQVTFNICVWRCFRIFGNQISSGNDLHFRKLNIKNRIHIIKNIIKCDPLSPSVPRSICPKWQLNVALQHISSCVVNLWGVSDQDQDCWLKKLGLWAPLVDHVYYPFLFSDWKSCVRFYLYFSRTCSDSMFLDGRKIRYVNAAYHH